jgi:SulP family sulfate permease
VLGAIIIDAVVFGMIDLGALKRLYVVKRFDFWIAMAAVVAVLSAGVLAGVLVGIALSLGWLVYVATAPGIPILGREPGTHAFRDLAENPADETFPGIVVVALDAGLFFATADALEERIRSIVTGGEEVRAVVLDCEGIDFVDSQGAAKLNELLEYAESASMELRLARVKPNVARVLERDGVLGRVGESHIHGNVQRAVMAQLDADGIPRPV